MKRFQDENKRSYNFTEAIAVKCPKCHKQASVTKIADGKKGYGYTKILACRHCRFSQLGGMIKYKAVVDQYCCNNSEKVNYESQLLNKKPETVRLKCGSCNEIKAFKPKIVEVYMQFVTDENNYRECCFNTELWFQTAVKGNIFWAYNEAHIGYMERYIAADLRERNSQYNGGKTMVASLPGFIKDAKNREKLLKAIQQWKGSYR